MGFESVVSFVVPVLVSNIQVEEATWSILKHDVQLKEMSSVSADEYRSKIETDHGEKYRMRDSENPLHGYAENPSWLTQGCAGLVR
jgi:hypothetical protein